MDLKIFDVEHGACALLSCDDGKRLMIDCGHNGATGWRPGTYLAERNISELDMLAITNYDEDHVSGLPNLAQHVNIHWLLRNKSVSSEALRKLKSEDGMGAGIEYLADMLGTYTAGPGPTTPAPVFDRVSYKKFRHSYPEYQDENNLSMVLNLHINGLSFLFPGDLETAGWDDLLARNAEFREAVAGVDVLIASHHGRENGVSTRLFDVHGCRPELVVISDKGYMYDTQETVDYYGSKARGVKLDNRMRYVLTTRYDGCIQFGFTNRPHKSAEVNLNYDIDGDRPRGVRWI